MATIHNAVHPGRMLKQWFGTRSLIEAAALIEVSVEYLSNVYDERAGITAEMSVKLSEVLGTSPALWFRLQFLYDQWQASQQLSD
jgi:addiction module HigA family antidote